MPRLPSSKNIFLEVLFFVHEAIYLLGDCLNVGCVPSKALIRAAHAAASGDYSGLNSLIFKLGKLPNLESMSKVLLKLTLVSLWNDSVD